MTYRRDTHFPHEGDDGFQPTYDIWAHTRERLAWRHGPDAAALKIRGIDAETQADLAAWRLLGAKT